MLDRGITLEALKDYPHAICILDHNSNIIYKNDKMNSLTRNAKCKTCCELLNTIGKNEICPNKDECFINHESDEMKFLKIDKKEFAITCTKVEYKYVDEEQFLLSIKELKQGNHYNRRSEIYRNHIEDKIHLGVAIYSEMGGELLLSEPLDWVKETSLENLYLNLSAFWFPAIGQGDNWQIGFYGPLPLLNFQDKLTFAFAFNLTSNPRTDLRLHHFGYTLLFLMIDREIVDFFTPFSAIEKIIAYCLSSFQNEEDFDLFNLIQLKSHILELIFALNP